MPCRLVGVPVMIDMLFGQVNDGIEPSATVANPCAMKRAVCGIAPSRRNWRRYAGSPPSMQTATSGRDGQRYAVPLTVTKDFSLAMNSHLLNCVDPAGGLLGPR